MAVRSIIGLSGQGLNSTVQKTDRRDFIGNTENTPLKSASSWLDINLDQDRIDETRDIEIFEDGNFPALRPNYGRQAYTHHNDRGMAVMENNMNISWWPWSLL